MVTAGAGTDSERRTSQARTFVGGRPLTAPYVELHAHSAFSFLDGTSTPAELAARAAGFGYPAFALTDHDGIWGSLEFALACRELGIRPITGAELTLAGGAHLTLLVESHVGYRNLCRLLTIAHSHTREGAQRSAGRPWVRLEQLEAHAEGLVCLSGCARDGALAGAWDRGEAPVAAALGRRLREAFGPEHFRVELQRPYWRRDRARNRWLSQLGERLGVPCVATGDIHCHDAARLRLQDAFVAVRLGLTLEASEPQRRGNSSSILCPPPRMAERFAEHPEAVTESVRLAERLRFDLTRELGYRYPGSEDSSADLRLAELCRARFEERYPPSSGYRGEAEGTLERELATIRNLGLSGFFLLHREILELAHEVAAEVRGPDSSRSVLPPGRGRGSSVSSIVCYLTGLSHIDPVEKGLFSARFLNEELGQTMPDIDLDFPRDIREVLIPRVHEVYGTDRAALVAAFPTYRPRGAVRDLGKALALPAKEIERVAAVVGFHERSGQIKRDVVAAIGERRAAAPGWRALLQLCGEAMGLPRHASQHPGGMVISTRPLIDVCPVVPAAMEGRQILQWDKDSCSDAGFLKIDLLGLGMLSAVERCIDEVRRTRPADPPLDLSRIDFEDGETFGSIQRAETTGVFQIESRAQMQMLPRTLPQSLDDLTVQVALVRPGPIQGGAVHPYIERRKLQREDPGFEIPYEHPLLEAALEDTLGTIVYQEQVLEVAKALAGFSSAEAESLRRAMSRRRSEEAIERHHLLFLEGARRRGVSPETAQSVWEQIEGFSGFGFPKAHSAAFGLLAYQSAWLRVHRAPEFLCALLNEQPMGFYPPDSLVHEAQRRGVTVIGPDANRSHVPCRVERQRGGLVVCIGLGYVKGVRREEMESLVTARRAGPYLGIADIASRSGAGRDGLERLAWAGAFDGIPLAAADRRGALWQAGIVPTTRGAADGTQLALPLEPPPPPELAPLGDWEEMIADYRSTGMVLGEHPMSMLRESLSPTVLRSTDLERVDDGDEVEVAGMVLARQRPETARGIVFMLFEDERGTVNLIVPPPVYDRHRALIRAAPLLCARGRLERREGVANVIVSEVAELHHAPVIRSPRLGEHPRKRSERSCPPASAARERRRAHREGAVAELRAVAPAGHSWGRRGR